MNKAGRHLRECWYRLTAPHLDWIQVEVTTHCNAKCTYCPHWILRDGRRPGHMDMDVFSRLARAFPRSEMVHLQGWGEPLLHPDFFEMARIAKKASCKVGTTTNGSLCTAEVCERLVEVGFDTVAFSLAGTDQRQDQVRRGTGIESVLRAVELLDRTKTRRGSRIPAVHIAYLALRSRLHDVAELPRLLEGLGVNQVVISTLDLVLHRDLESETLAPEGPEEEAYLVSVLEHAAAEGKKRGVDIHYRLASHTRRLGAATNDRIGLGLPRTPIQGRSACDSMVGRDGSTPIRSSGDPSRRSATSSCDEAGSDHKSAGPERSANHSSTEAIGYCTENVTNAVVVSVDGSVWPCVFANVQPGTTPDMREFRFGNLADESLSAIWATREYRAFREAHERQTPPERCLSCPKMLCRLHRGHAQDTEISHSYRLVT